MSMTNFRAEDMPNTKKIAYAKGGKKPAVSEDSGSVPVADDPNEVPVGTAAEVARWVGDDPERAQQALDAESASDKPRSTLIADLERVIAKDENDEDENQDA